MAHNYSTGDQNASWRGSRADGTIQKMSSVAAIDKLSTKWAKPAGM